MSNLVRFGFTLQELTGQGLECLVKDGMVVLRFVDGQCVEDLYAIPKNTVVNHDQTREVA